MAFGTRCDPHSTPPLFIKSFVQKIFACWYYLSEGDELYVKAE